MNQQQDINNLIFTQEQDFKEFIEKLRKAILKFEKKFGRIGHDNILSFTYTIKGEPTMQMDYTIDNIRTMECFHDMKVREFYGDDQTKINEYTIMCKGNVTMAYPNPRDVRLFMELSKHIRAAMVIPMGG